MSTPTPSPALTDEELDRLEEHLASDVFDGEAMALDELQGFLCAIVSGPQVIPPSEWIPIAFGESPRWQSEEQSQEVLGLVMRFYNQVVHQFMSGEGFDFVLYRPDENSEYDYETWCSAYLDGVEASPVPWEEAGDADEIDELLFPIVALADELAPEDVQRMKAGEHEQLLAACREDFPGVLVDIHRYFFALRGKPETVRREGDKVGRNDPCPCGSGKKYKQCCGAPRVVH